MVRVERYERCAAARRVHEFRVRSREPQLGDRVKIWPFTMLTLLYIKFAVSWSDSKWVDSSPPKRGHQNFSLMRYGLAGPWTTQSCSRELGKTGLRVKWTYNSLEKKYCKICELNKGLSVTQSIVSLAMKIVWEQELLVFTKVFKKLVDSRASKFANTIHNTSKQYKLQSMWPVSNAYAIYLLH